MAERIVEQRAKATADKEQQLQELIKRSSALATAKLQLESDAQQRDAQMQAEIERSVTWVTWGRVHRACLRLCGLDR